MHQLSATTTVPIVFAAGGDPVRDGLVASLNRPGGNVTGVSFLAAELGAKRLGRLLAFENAAGISAGQAQDGEGAATATSKRPLQGWWNAGLVRCSSALPRSRIRVASALSRWRPDMPLPPREFATAGGLMSYGRAEWD
jgi:hypothetical protein